MSVRQIHDEIPSSSGFEQANRDTYRNPQVVRWYADYESLYAPEEAILTQYGPALEGGRILDIGVGGGRTTPYLSRLAGEYIGIDYSPEMVAKCRLKYPALLFLECDARHLTPFSDASFDAVFFSLNGIDYVNHPNRLMILREVHRVLKAGGLFIFSSHNRDTKLRPLWIEPTRHPIKWLARVLRFYRGKLRHRINRRRETHRDDYCIINDATHEHQLMTYYISPLRQIEQLRQQGYHQDIHLFDTDGRQLDQPVSDAEYLYYCAGK